MSTPKKKITEKKEFPPALVELAEKIDKMAVRMAGEKINSICTRLVQIMHNSDVTREMMRIAAENIENFEVNKCAPVTPEYVYHARQEIINKLIQEDKKDEL
jgi:uncharacterized protein (UPF0147 family)